MEVLLGKDRVNIYLAEPGDLHDGYCLPSSLLLAQRDGLHPPSVSGILARVNRPISVFLHMLKLQFFFTCWMWTVDLPPVVVPPYLEQIYFGVAMWWLL